MYFATTVAIGSVEEEFAWYAYLSGRMLHCIKERPTHSAVIRQIILIDSLM